MLEFLWVPMEALFLHTLPSFLSDFIMAMASFTIYQPVSPAQTTALSSWTTETMACPTDFLISAEASIPSAAQAKPAWSLPPYHAVIRSVNSPGDPPGSAVLKSNHISTMMLF